MKTAISIPDPLFRSADRLAARLRLSRSALYARAVGNLVDRHRGDLVTGKLNEIYGAGGESSRVPADVKAFQSRSLPREKW